MAALPATEAMLAERDIAPYPTILSGDLDGNDNANVAPDEQTRAENAYHVVVGSDTDGTAKLDGFTITGGNANDDFAPDRLGGGMYNLSGSPTVKNVTFSGNSANYGGGMYNGSSGPTLANVTFSGNAAIYGGGMYNGSSGPTLTNVTFSGNSATLTGGGMFNVSNSSPKLINVIIANSTKGGDCVNGTSTLDAASSHNLIADDIKACGLTHDVKGNIIGADPKLGLLADNGGATQTHALLPGSPAIDRGTCDPDLGVLPADQRGVAWPQGIACDIGALEAERFLILLPLVQR